jgi:hypothetical protein
VYARDRFGDAGWGLDLAAAPSPHLWPGRDDPEIDTVWNGWLRISKSQRQSISKAISLPPGGLWPTCRPCRPQHVHFWRLSVKEGQL